MKKISIILIYCIMISVPVHAQEIKEINWGTEIWKGFTDKDGSGLYDQVFRSIFNQKGIQINVSYMPFARTLHLVKIAKLDFAGGIPKIKEKTKDFIQSKYPVAVSKFNVFFHKDAIQNWEGIATIKGKRIVATPEMAEMVGLSHHEVYEVTERKQALQMVLTKRSEIYIDDEKVLETTVSENKSLFNMNDYRIENLTVNGWYMIAPNTDRGKMVMRIYEEGTEELDQTGELRSIYERLGFSVPDLSRYQ